MLHLYFIAYKLTWTHEDSQFSPQMVLVVVRILNTCVLDLCCVLPVHGLDARNKNQLCSPIFSMFSSGIFYSAMKSFNSLPSNLKNLRNNKEQFKIIPLKCYISHSFYSFIEFFEHHTNNTHKWYFKVYKEWVKVKHNYIYYYVAIWWKVANNYMFRP